jgi:pimeloyl-ACP methyl ester carboxylesterase
MKTSVIEPKQQRISGTAGSLYVDDGGSGKTPVLFMHSFGGNTSHWKNQLEHLRKTRRAIAFDFRGHGKSDPSLTNNYSADDLADDLESVIESLHLNQVVLVGHSMGGAAAAAFAGKHPARVAGLVLAGTPGKSKEQQSKQIISALESDAYDKVMDDYMKQLLSNANPKVESQLKDGVKKISKPTSISIVKAMFQFDPLPVLEWYKGPKLIIGTAQENENPESLSHQAPYIPSKIIEGTSHWMQLDKPEEFNNILDDFLKNI